MLHCFYHSADLDGHCSGAIVKYRYPEAVMHPINYGQEFPFNEVESDSVVYMVDFCLQPDEKMIELHDYLHEGCGELHWIDHHKSQEHLKDRMLHWQGYFNTTKAACELVWEYIFPNKPVPLAVKLLSLYDSWTYQGHKLEPMVLPFQMRMRMENIDPKNWYELNRASSVKEIWEWLFTGGDIYQLIKDGELLLRYDEEQNRRYVSTYGFETRMPIHKETWSNADRKHNPSVVPPKLKAIAVNLGHTNSKVFDSVWRRECPECFKGEKKLINFMGTVVKCKECNGTGYIEPYDIMITFCRRSDRKWNVSLYSTKPDIDCGAIAKSFGGGGHMGSAGFQCEQLPFDY